MATSRFAVVDDPISAAQLRDLVAGPGDGAVCTFEGTVRDHTGDAATTHLEYEAQAALAEKVFADIAAVASRRWGISAMAIHHRVGRLEIGEVSVAIAVAAEHRGEAFAACRYAIDQLKRSAPVWKKEFGANGAYWVEGPTATAVEPADAAGDGDDTDRRGAVDA
jgi:molybdopterin synthase catalytic subunit